MPRGTDRLAVVNSQLSARLGPRRARGRGQFAK